MTSSNQSASPGSPRPDIAAQLAIHGGRPTLPEGPPAWPLEDEDVRDALESAYRDGSWGQYRGPHCELLAERLSDYHDCRHALLCCSGTLAVELALRGLGVGAGDEVILAGYGFPGNFRAVEAVGARPVLVDIDERTWSLNPDVLDEAAAPAVKAIIASHLHGGIVPMDRLMEWAKQHAVAVVEDACQAPGALIAGRRAGAWGDVGVLSFGGSKLLTAGRGGALLTSRDDIYQRAKIFCERGNHAFPLSELQAAVLLPQLDKLDTRNATRAENVARLVAQLRKLKGLRPLENHRHDVTPAYYKLAVCYESELFRDTSRDDFTTAVRTEGVALDAGFRGFARRSRRRCRHVGPLAHSRRAAEAMLLLHHPVLLQPPETIDRVAAAVEKVVRGLSGSRRPAANSP